MTCILRDLMIKNIAMKPSVWALLVLQISDIVTTAWIP